MSVTVRCMTCGIKIYAEEQLDEEGRCDVCVEAITRRAEPIDAVLRRFNAGRLEGEPKVNCPGGDA